MTARRIQHLGIAFAVVDALVLGALWKRQEDHLRNTEVCSQMVGHTKNGRAVNPCLDWRDHVLQFPPVAFAACIFLIIGLVAAARRSARRRRLADTGLR